MALKQRLYDYNVCVLKKYTDDCYKLTRHKILRNKGVESDDVVIRSAPGTVNDVKLLENISRAKSKIFEYGICNDWDFFVTLTIDQDKFNRYDLKSYYKSFSQWLRDYQKKYNLKIRYLFIPEQHQDGAWHLHGLISGLPAEHLTINQYGYFDWDAYKNKFGYISMDKLKDKEKASSYLLKYVGKGFGLNVTELNANLYYCSRGLKVAEVIKKGSISQNIEPDYSNDYIESKKFSDRGLAEELFD